MLVLTASKLQLKPTGKWIIACLGCKHPTCLTIILFYLPLLFVEKDTPLVLTEKFLWLAPVPGNLREENKFILVKAMVSLDYEVQNVVSKHKHKKTQA